MIRRSFYALSVVVLLAALVGIPMPFIEFSPGSSTPIEPLITIERDTTPIEGDLDLLTVRVGQPSLLGVVQAWFSDTRELQRQTSVIPEGVSQDQFFEQERIQFRTTFDVAAAVAVRRAGFDVTIRTNPQVVAVLPGSPADGSLVDGDVIVVVNGEPVTTSEDLRELTQATPAGEELAMQVLRNGEPVDTAVRTAMLEGVDRPAIGVLIETAVQEVALPFKVELDPETRIGGPSAGMMFALTIYDLLSPDDLAAGRKVAGTGTINADGVVGPIGGIEEKVIAASNAGAAIMIAPADQAEAARAVAPDGLEIVSAGTLDDAIDALLG